MTEQESQADNLTVDAFHKELISDLANSYPEPLDSQWSAVLLSVVADLIAMASSAVFTASSPQGVVQVRASRSGDSLRLAATGHGLLASGKVLRPAAVRTLWRLGWHLPNVEVSPDFYQLMTSDIAAEEIGRFLVLTLRDAYRVDPSSVVAETHKRDTPYPPPGLLQLLPQGLREEVAAEPHRFFTQTVGQLAAELVECGAIVLRCGPDDLALAYVNEEFTLEDTANAVLVSLSLGPFQLCRPVLDQLARMHVWGHEREVYVSDDVWVEATESFANPGANEILDWVEELSGRYRDDLDGAETTYTKGNSLPDLEEKFVAAGLGVPHVPLALRRRLKMRDTWWWATEETPEPMEDYLLRSVELLKGVVADHVSVSHAGHGVNSYALTWRLAFGPLAMIVQAPWGGGFSDEGRDVGDQAAMFRNASLIVKKLENREESPSEPRVRNFLVIVSLLDGRFACAQFDGRHQRWDTVDMPPLDGSLDPRALSTWWQRVDELVVEARGVQ
jgi:hypothetical protein